MKNVSTGTLKLLSHTPVKQAGINREAHFRSPNEEAWHPLGHRLAPKEPWDGLLEKPGMLAVQMQGHRPDRFAGSLQVTVQPSKRFQPGFGVFLLVNDHYEYDGDENGQQALHMLETIQTTWECSLDRSARIMQGLLQA